MQNHQRQTPWQDLHESLLDPPVVHLVHGPHGHYHPYLFDIGREIWQQITEGAMIRPCRQLDKKPTKYCKESSVFGAQNFLGHSYQRLDK